MQVGSKSESRLVCLHNAFLEASRFDLILRGLFGFTEGLEVLDRLSCQLRQRTMKP